MSLATTDKVPLSDYESASEEEPGLVMTMNSETEGHTSDDGSSNTRDEVARVEEIIAKETKVVNRWRFVVILAMTLVAAGVMAATYIIMNQEEEKAFENAFQQYASTLVESSSFTAETIQESCQDFADQMTSSAKSLKHTWPYVTLPDLDIHGANLRKQTNSVGFAIIHFLSAQQKQNWTPYVLANAPSWYGNSSFLPVPYVLTETLQIQFDSPSPQWPIWQADPWPVQPVTNLDMKPFDTVQRNGLAASQLGEGVMGEIEDNNNIAYAFPTVGSVAPRPDEPHSIFYQPLYNNFSLTERQAVGLVLVVLRWGLFFNNKIPKDVNGIHLVLESSCANVVTYEIVDGIAVYKGKGDLSDKSYKSYEMSAPFNTYANSEQANELGACLFLLKVYPSSTTEDEYKSALPIVLAIVVGGIFVSMVLSFLAYDRFQRQRNKKVVANAANSNALVTSLFPENIRDRLLKPVDSVKDNRTKRNNSHFKSNKGHIKTFLEGEDEVAVLDQPIADLFTDVTVMMADLTGFTAWSSQREPSQVFSLLEILFGSLDQMAKRRRVFKVETVGDCYVCVAGLPEPRKDHAQVMARFARETIRKVQLLVKQLETTFGPDTGDLGIRIGLHSGVVTAGVLRGDRARFQLFGDTVNTTARIESSGQRNRVHMSQDTADCLAKAGKGHWAVQRDTKITAKGKGEMQTYWLSIKDNAQSVASGDGSNNWWGDAEVENNKLERLIDWQVEVFTRLLKQVVAQRKAIEKSNQGSQHLVRIPALIDSVEKGQGTCLDEVKEIISLPEFDASVAQSMAEDVELGDTVIDQIRSYIRTISCMYRSNGFHNFEHACHVTMSVTKLLSRIQTPSDLLIEEETSEGSDNSDSVKFAPSLAPRIARDPLTQFSMVFSALVHDVDHTGVPNSMLIKENEPLCRLYNEKSVAEQHSIDLAWNLLQAEEYVDLRSCIYATQAEFERFRQLVVQVVLATDIMDKDLKQLRNQRWEKAFSEKVMEESPQDTVNRKATIVIEHLIQASDVAHTMQHWHVYLKWNERFFRECYQAWKDGRAASDPSLNWYKGEIGFFDFYIIPLARKLQKCGVFGVSSDEYLNYALKNRQEWENRGQQVVEEMLQAILSEQEEDIGEETEVFRNE